MNKKEKTIVYTAGITSICLLGGIAAIIFALNYTLWALIPLLTMATLSIIMFLFYDMLGIEDTNKNPATETETKAVEEGKDKSKDMKRTAIKWVALVIAVVLMGFAQSILSAAHKFGMAPIDAMTTGLSFMVGSSYSLVNYLVVFLLVFAAVILTKDKKDRVLATTAYITGLSLALLVRTLTVNVVSHWGWIHDTGNFQLETFKYWQAIPYFILGYGLLTVSIGIWLNVGFGLRPYDLLLLTLDNRFEKYSYVFWRNTIDAVWLVLALIFSGIAIAVYPEHSGIKDFLNMSAFNFGTILFVFATGYITSFLRNTFAKIIK